MDTTAAEVRKKLGMEGMPSREKYWEELSIEEKIERARQVTKQTQANIDRISAQLNRLELMFRGHEHNDGKLVFTQRQIDEIGDSAPDQRHRVFGLGSMSQSGQYF